jgi:hypothetical protein
MKSILGMTLVLVAGGACAGQQAGLSPDEQCKRNVVALLDGIDAAYDWQHKRRPENLERENLKKFEESNGSCSAEAEIKNRLAQFNATQNASKK